MLTLFQKSLLATIALGVLLVAFVIAAKAPAQATTIAPAVQVPVNAVVPQGIVTTGDATVRVKPDAAIVTVGAVVQGATADKAQALLSDRIAKVLDRAKALAIADGDTKTVAYRIDPQYAYEQGKAPRLVGFQANQQLALTLHGTDGVGKALDTLVQNDGATTATVQFTLLDAKAAQASAREQAIQDARGKAIAMARTAGVQLGKVTSVSDLASSPSFDAFKAMIPAPGPLGPSAAAQLPTGQLDVVVRGWHASRSVLGSARAERERDRRAVGRRPRLPDREGRRARAGARGRACRGDRRSAGGGSRPHLRERRGSHGSAERGELSRARSAR